MTRAVIAQTDRLTFHRLEGEDAPFILALLNDPSWLQFIGDKKVYTLAAADRWINEGPRRMYAEHGFGLYLVRLRSAQAGSPGSLQAALSDDATTKGDGTDGSPVAAATPIGICGLIRRDGLDDVDLGFAYLPRFWKRGYATEAGDAMLAQARALKLSRVAAIADPENSASRRVLERLGFKLERLVHVHGEPAERCLYLRQTSSPAQPQPQPAP